MRARRSGVVPVAAGRRRRGRRDGLRPRRGDPLPGDRPGRAPPGPPLPASTVATRHPARCRTPAGRRRPSRFQWRGGAPGGGAGQGRHAHPPVNRPRQGLRRDGDNPTLLVAYGSYGYPLRPEFSPEMLAWYERGGVYAAAHVRGGGEHSLEWHEAGSGAAPSTSSRGTRTRGGSPGRARQPAGRRIRLPPRPARARTDSPDRLTVALARSGQGGGAGAGVGRRIRARARAATSW